MSDLHGEQYLSEQYENDWMTDEEYDAMMLEEAEALKKAMEEDGIVLGNTIDDLPF